MNITLHLTNDCNLRCSYCYHEKLPTRMSLDTAKAAIDLAANDSNAVSIGFYGGEPLLEKELIKNIIQYCTAKSNKEAINFTYKITTNGTLIDNEFLNLAKEHSIIVAISHDGLSQDETRLNKNGDSVGHIVDLNLQKTINEMPYTPVLLTIHPDKISYLSESVRMFVEDYNLRYVFTTPAFGPLVEWDDKSFKELKKQYQLIANLYEKWMQKGRKFYFGAFENKITSYIDQKSCCPNICELGKTHISIAPNGDIYPCTQFVNDENYYMGSVFTGLDLNASERFSQSFKEDSECEKCILKLRCRHTCGCSNKLTSGNPKVVGAAQCEHERILIDIADKIAAKLYNNNNRQFIRMHYDDYYPLISLIEDKLS